MSTCAAVELVTICFSHYNERARWAFAWHGVPFVERPNMPGFHFRAVKKVTGGRGGEADGVSSRFSTPVLRRDDGSLLTDSAEILRWVDAEYGREEHRLYPEGLRAEIEAFESSVEGKFGADTRRVAYLVLLGEPKMVNELARRNVSRGQARAFRLVRPVVGRLIKRGLGVDEKRGLRSLLRVEEMMQAVSERLEGREFLVGDRFTAADLTFACMAAPVLLPQRGYGAWLPSPDDIEHPLRPRLEAIMQSPAGQHALRMFDEHRPPSAASSAP